MVAWREWVWGGWAEREWKGGEARRSSVLSLLSVSFSVALRRPTFPFLAEVSPSASFLLVLTPPPLSPPYTSSSAFASHLQLPPVVIDSAPSLLTSSSTAPPPSVPLLCQLSSSTSCCLFPLSVMSLLFFLCNAHWHSSQLSSFRLISSTPLAVSGHVFAPFHLVPSFPSSFICFFLSSLSLVSFISPILFPCSRPFLLNPFLRFVHFLPFCSFSCCPCRLFTCTQTPYSPGKVLSVLLSSVCLCVWAGWLRLHPEWG